MYICFLHFTGCSFTPSSWCSTQSGPAAGQGSRMVTRQAWCGHGTQAEAAWDILGAPFGQLGAPGNFSLTCLEKGKHPLGRRKTSPSPLWDPCIPHNLPVMGSWPLLPSPMGAAGSWGGGRGWSLLNNILLSSGISRYLEECWLASLECERIIFLWLL